MPRLDHHNPAQEITMDSATVFLVSILSSTAVSAVLSLVLNFFLRDVIGKKIQAEHDQELQAFKNEQERELTRLTAELHTAGDRAHANLEARLEVAVTKHQLRFESLHNKSGEVVGHVYEQLARLKKATVQFVRQQYECSEEAEKQRCEEVNEASKEFFDYFEAKRIYLDKECALDIDKLHQSFKRLIENFHYGTSRPTEDGVTLQKWDIAKNAFEQDLTPLLDHLEEKFRVLVGHPSRQ